MDRTIRVFAKHGKYPYFGIQLASLQITFSLLIANEASVRFQCCIIDVRK